MPTIIDSLFLELGIDTSKFTADEQKTLAKIAEFEKQAKKGADTANKSVKTVGKSFGDLASDTRIGAGAKRIEALATKITMLGKSVQIAGGAGSAFGGMIEGLGTLLSPVTMGTVAVGLLGKEVWSLDSKMTGLNASTERYALTAGMAGKETYAFAQAGRLVGGTTQDIPAGLAALQTTVAGAMIGAGDATAQLVQLSRLGVKWDPSSKKPVDEMSLFAKVHEAGLKYGRTRARALSSTLFNETEFNLSQRPDWRAQVKALMRKAPVNIDDILKGSLKKQEQLGNVGAAGAGLMERAYSATGDVFVTMMVGIQSLVGYVSSIWDFLRSKRDTVRRVVHGAEGAARAAVTLTPDADAAALGAAIGNRILKGFSTPSISQAATTSTAAEIAEGPGAPLAPLGAALGERLMRSMLPSHSRAPTQTGVAPAPMLNVRAAPDLDMAGITDVVTGIHGILNRTLGYLVKLVDFAGQSLLALSKRGAISVGETQSAQGIAGEQDVQLGTFISQGIRRLFSSPPAAASRELKAREALAMKTLIERGVPAGDAGAIVGNFVQESTLDPLATSDNGAHLGLAQWDRKRQRSFAKQFGYPMGSPTVPVTKQFLDQLAFAQNELATTQRAAWRQMVSALTLFGKTQAFEAGYEKPGDLSLGRRFFDAERALALVSGFSSMLAAANANPSAVHHNIRSSTRIGDIHVHTPSTDPKAHAAAVAKAVSTHPLITPVAQQMVALAAGSTVR